MFSNLIVIEVRIGITYIVINKFVGVPIATKKHEAKHLDSMHLNILLFLLL